MPHKIHTIIMATLNMNGPFELTAEKIDKEITRKCAGNYAYGHTNMDGSFSVSYVGRSDTDLNSRIKHGVGKYRQFKYSYAASVLEAYKKECNNFHDFKCPANEIHPDKPDGYNCSCPHCGK